MNADFLLLKAQNDAFRTYFLSLLPVIMGDRDRVWLAKFLLWRFERENLAPFDYISTLPSPEIEKIHHRRFQLQVLMDVAYIRGHLQGPDIIHAVSPSARTLADTVYSRSDGSEAGMCKVIDDIYNS